MTLDKLAEEYFRWRFEQMKTEAPAAPSAAELIKRALPWRERFPDRFRTLVSHFEMAGANHDDNGDHQASSLAVHAVPALIVRGKTETIRFAQVLDFKIHEGKLHFRFQLQPPFSPAVSALEVTIISDTASHPLVFALAYGSGEIGHIVYTDLPPELVQDWALLKETDHLPFRLILSLKPET